jgi:hypothetical protein
MKKKDLIISLASNLSYEQLLPWIQSFSRVNNSAEKVILLFNADKETINKLNEFKFKIISPSELKDDGSLSYNSTNTHMNVERFLHFWNYLKNSKDEYRYIISCDSRDIIFQRDPFRWLEVILSRNTHINFIASEEPCFYKDETFWGAQNFYHSFGPVAYNHIKDRVIYNAGTIAGRASHVIDLFALIYYISINNKVQNPDQAAYNFLLSLEPYKSMTHFSSPEEDFAAQVGILMHPQFDEKRIGPKPIWDGNYLYTQNRNRYCIVHQYDRDKELLAFVNQEYGVNIPGY